MLPTVVRSTSQQDLVAELKLFVRSATNLDKCNPLDLAKTALTLLKALPAARIAVFEYFSKVFERAAANYIKGVDLEVKNGSISAQIETDELVVAEIHAVLAGLITENSQAWAPNISTWSLELLGEISTKYAKRGHITNLNEILQLWMSCRATRTLVDINTKCLSSLMHSDTEACINALLDTSVKHSPHFDWVVAHVGSCFPNTVITRVLSCGLKDFCQIKSYEQGSNSPKLKSVVGILGHLAASHSGDIRKAILEMFTWSLRETFDDSDLSRLQKKATVPFILQLCSLSSTLLTSVSYDTKHFLTFETIGRLYHFIDDWCKYFGTPEGLEELIISLIMRCEAGGVQIISLILDCTQIIKLKANETVKNEIREKSKEMLQNIMYELDECVRHKNSVNLIQSLLKEVKEVKKMLLSEAGIVRETAARIIIFLSHWNTGILIQSVSFLLCYADNRDQLVLLIRILTNELIDNTHCGRGGHFTVVLEQILSKDIQKITEAKEDKPDLSLMWNNLLTLLRWEKSEKVPLLQSKLISRAIEANFISLTSLFSSEKVHVHVIADILDELQIPSKNSNLPDVQAVLNLTQSTVNYFFICCKETGTSLKVRGFLKVSRLLSRLCTYAESSRVLALRELLERALFRSDNVLFGAKNQINHEENEKLLLKQNKKFNKTIPLTKHSSVFNGGIIGNGKRKCITISDVPEEIVRANTVELIAAIRACCSLPKDVEEKFKDLHFESMTLLSLLLVQFVSPDVMYNGLPWPEEEFSKVTIERDLFIRKMFQNNPLLWELLSFVAIYRPALSFCSVLIRALTATLIHQWRSMGEQSKANETDNYKSLMETTIRVVDLMSLGQLLPPPLSSIRDILPFLKCYEIVAILRDCIWSYLKDNVPSPAMFTMDKNGISWRDPTVVRPSDNYTNALRIIMQRNIKTLGHMYAQMFINVPSHE